MLLDTIILRYMIEFYQTLSEPLQVIFVLIAMYLLMCVCCFNVYKSKMKGTLQEALTAAREQLGFNKPKDLLYMTRDSMTVDEEKALDKMLGKSVVDEAKTVNYLANQRYLDNEGIVYNDIVDIGSMPRVARHQVARHQVAVDKWKALANSVPMFPKRTGICTDCEDDCNICNKVR